MTIKAKHALFVIFLFLATLGSSKIWAGGIRTLSMGRLQLAIPDTDNQLNFYDFGRNPAGLQSDQQYRWMRVYLHAQSHWGAYHRLYEPSNEQNYSLTFEGVKALNSKETFWGQITYLGDYPHLVYRSLEKSPYAKNFILTDTTTGNYWYNGPVIQTIYSRKLSEHFALGLRFNYKVQMGLKDIYTKVESIQREIFPGIGLSWGVRRKMPPPQAFSSRNAEASLSNQSPFRYGVGVFCSPYDNQTRLTAVKEMQDAVVYRQIGVATRFRQVRGKYVRIYRTKGVLLVGQAFISPFQWMRFGVLHRYRAAGTTATDNLFVKRGYEQQIQNQTVGRMQVQTSDFQIGVQLLRESFDDWSKSIEYKCLYGEQTRRRIQAGVGVGTAGTGLPVTIGAEFYTGFFTRMYRDYLSHEKVETRQPEWQVRAGMETPLFSKRWYLRLGGIWGQQVPDLFYLFEREKLWQLTGALSWQASHFRISLLGVFHKRLPKDSPFQIEQPLYEGSFYWPQGSRQQASVLLFLQLWGK